MTNGAGERKAEGTESQKDELRIMKEEVGKRPNRDQRRVIRPTPGYGGQVGDQRSETSRQRFVVSASRSRGGLRFSCELLLPAERGS